MEFELTRAQVAASIIGAPKTPARKLGRAYAPSNIALCKYWGKRNVELNLPVNSSLSVSLGPLGTTTTVSRADVESVWLNGDKLREESPFAKRVSRYLDLLRPRKNFYFKIETHNSIPTAAGLASSASGFAALVLALDEFFGWGLDKKSLSILARLGSGSASRSLYHGFVEWRRGNRTDGMDSYAEAIPARWPELRIAVLSVSTAAKPTGSTEGMNRTVHTSSLYNSWPDQAQKDLATLRRAVADQDFASLGATAECNALAMHATMLAAQPPLLYWLPQTVALFHKIRHLRQQGLPLYFTIDAGPNVKLLFEQDSLNDVGSQFPEAKIVAPFHDGVEELPKT